MSFDCCSRYQKCSDVGKCLFPNDIDYQGCTYGKHLEAGRNFYSKKNKGTEIFIDCYKRLFKIGKRNKVGLTFSLKQEHKELLDECFKKNNIPFMESQVQEKCVIEGDFEEPANSLVVLKVDGEEFNISNYNSYLMLNKYAEGISKALKSKGFQSHVEVNGSLARQTHIAYIELFKKNKQIEEDAQMKKIFDKPIKKIGPKTNIKYEQISLFSII